VAISQVTHHPSCQSLPPFRAFLPITYHSQNQQCKLSPVSVRPVPQVTHIPTEEDSCHGNVPSLHQCRKIPVLERDYHGRSPPKQTVLASQGGTVPKHVFVRRFGGISFRPGLSGTGGLVGMMIDFFCCCFWGSLFRLRLSFCRGRKIGSKAWDGMGWGADG
jgi:hypothetical protein